MLWCRQASCATLSELNVPDGMLLAAVASAPIATSSLLFVCVHGLGIQTDQRVIRWLSSLSVCRFSCVYVSAKAPSFL